MTPTPSSLPPPPRAEGSERRDRDAFRAQRARDAALVLPLAGVALLTPPVASLFLTDATLWGAPLIGIYLFTVWGGLIVCALGLSRRLRKDEAR